MLKLLNGVLPAIERAIALGIADPENLFLMGQSFGGYAVYGLIAQTNRFKAAVFFKDMWERIFAWFQEFSPNNTR
ncbi:MAG: prolyl oligopeptidase family serine peptidase [Hydrococcus sp. Prado102]|jgi:dienelactone hydrolase|nr:prolyl oligopeptidase family serine peptidase [Hydrococcus sp. Prado102]